MKFVEIALSTAATLHWLTDHLWTLSGVLWQVVGKSSVCGKADFHLFAEIVKHLKQ